MSSDRMMTILGLGERGASAPRVGEHITSSAADTRRVRIMEGLRKGAADYPAGVGERASFSEAFPGTTGQPFVPPRGVVMDRRSFLAASLTAPFAATAAAQPPVSRLLYVVCPGIRNYLEFGGAGILVFDIDNGHKFVKRIETTASKVEKPRNIKGVVASPATKKLHFTTPETLFCFDLLTEKTDWAKELPLGCDRLASTPDGRTLFMPSFEKDTWNVTDAATGNVLTVIETKSGANNTICSLDGTRAYLAGLKSPYLFVADAMTHKVIDKVGPFAASIRPFTVNAAKTLCFVNV